MTLLPVACRRVLGAALLLLAWMAFLVPAPSASADETAEGKELVSLVESWPENGFTMWLPPQQGRLEFSAPVRTSTMQLSLEMIDGVTPPSGEVTRLTRGEAVTRVLFRLPELSEGSYELTYSVEPVKGERVSGTVSFALGPEFSAPGGGNHRHSGSHIEYDNPWSLALKVLIVLAASLLMFSWRRSRQATRSLFDAVLPRAGGLLLAVYAASAGATAVLGAVEEHPSSPLEGVLASAAAWVFIPLFAAGAWFVITGRRDVVALLVAVASLLLTGFSLQHGDQAWMVASTVSLAALLVFAAVTLAALWESLACMTGSPSRSPWKALRVVGVSLALVVLFGFAMLVFHARGLQFNGDFHSDALMRTTASFAAAAGYGLLCVVSLVPSVAARRVLALLPAALVAAGTCALMWLPPPASGL